MTLGANARHRYLFSFERLGIGELAQERKKRGAVDNAYAFQRHAFADGFDGGADAGDKVQVAGCKAGKLKVAADLDNLHIQPVLFEELLVLGVIERHQDDILFGEAEPNFFQGPSLSRLEGHDTEK